MLCSPAIQKTMITFFLLLEQEPAPVFYEFGPGFDSHLTGFTGHASKSTEHGLWGFDQGLRSKCQRRAVMSNWLRGDGYPSMIPLKDGILFSSQTYQSRSVRWPYRVVCMLHTHIDESSPISLDGREDRRETPTTKSIPTYTPKRDQKNTKINTILCILSCQEDICS